MRCITWIHLTFRGKKWRKSQSNHRGVRNVVFKLNGTQTSARVVFKTRKQQSNASKYIYIRLSYFSALCGCACHEILRSGTRNVSLFMTWPWLGTCFGPSTWISHNLGWLLCFILVLFRQNRERIRLIQWM